MAERRGEGGGGGDRRERLCRARRGTQKVKEDSFTKTGMVLSRGWADGVKSGSAREERELGSSSTANPRLHIEVMKIKQLQRNPGSNRGQSLVRKYVTQIFHVSLCDMELKTRGQPRSGSLLIALESRQFSPRRPKMFPVFQMKLKVKCTFCLVQSLMFTQIYFTDNL